MIYLILEEKFRFPIRANCEQSQDAKLQAPEFRGGWVTEDKIKPFAGSFVNGFCFGGRKEEVGDEESN